MRQYASWSTSSRLKFHISAITFPMRFLTFVLIICALSVFGQNGPVQNPPSKALNDLFAAEWDYDMQQRPEQASNLGDRRWNDRWTDESLEAHARRHQHNQDVLARLAKID